MNQKFMITIETNDPFTASLIEDRLGNELDNHVDQDWLSLEVTEVKE